MSLIGNLKLSGLLVSSSIFDFVLWYHSYGVAHISVIGYLEGVACIVSMKGTSSSWRTVQHLQDVLELLLIRRL